MIIKKTSSGFTVVELLIVIVVIGILASITIVAYMGIQDRARNIQLLSAFDAYEKGLRQFKIFNGHYPYTTDTPQTSAMSVCLGEYPTTVAGIQPGFCAQMDWGGETTNNFPAIESVQNDLLQIMSSLPSVPDTVATVAGSGIRMNIRGILYFPAKGAQTARMYFYINGDMSCGRGEKTVSTSEGATHTTCEVTLD